MKDASRYLLASFAAILYVASVAKFGTLVFAPGAFGDADPVFGSIPSRYLIACAGLLEGLVAVLICATSNVRMRLLATAWLATLLVLYRMGLLFSQTGGGCPCLGILTTLLPRGLVGDSMSIVLLFYMLIGSYAFLVYEGWKRRHCDNSAI